MADQPVVTFETKVDTYRPWRMLPQMTTAPSSVQGSKTSGSN
jgi:hypothetical protein